MIRTFSAISFGVAIFMIGGCSESKKADSSTTATSTETTSTTSASSGTYLGAANNARKHANKVLKEVETERRQQIGEAKSFDSNSESK